MHFFWVLIVKLLSLQYFSDGIEQLLANNKSCECRFDNELVVCENCDSVSVRREIIKVGGRVSFLFGKSVVNRVTCRPNTILLLFS